MGVSPLWSQVDAVRAGPTAKNWRINRGWILARVINGVVEDASMAPFIKREMVSFASRFPRSTINTY
jgi:hypothetical protein